VIKIEVTGNSIGEVADKLLAIGKSLHNGATTWWEPTDAPQKLKAKLAAELEATMPELRDATGNAPSEAVSSGETEASPTAPSGSEPEAPTTGEPLNFELDVAPVVLRAVALKTKSFVQDVLSEFGSARASELDPARWPELIARLEAEMA
jgi:hypothetical protein